MYCFCALIFFHSPIFLRALSILLHVGINLIICTCFVVFSIMGIFVYLVIPLLIDICHWHKQYKNEQPFICILVHNGFHFK